MDGGIPPGGLRRHADRCSRVARPLVVTGPAGDPAGLQRRPLPLVDAHRTWLVGVLGGRAGGRPRSALQQGLDTSAAHALGQLLAPRRRLAERAAARSASTAGGVRVAARALPHEGLNHSPRFWALLGRHDTDCEAHRKALRTAKTVVPSWLDHDLGEPGVEEAVEKRSSGPQSTLGGAIARPRSHH